MITIHKFTLTIEDEQTLMLPVGHVVRHIGLDPQGSPSVWIELDTNAPKIEYTASVRGTGQPVPKAGVYSLPCFAGTLVHGAFVWHVWLA
jgi:hypothetical protein